MAAQSAPKNVGLMFRVNGRREAFPMAHNMAKKNDAEFAQGCQGDLGANSCHSIPS